MSKFIFIFCLFGILRSPGQATPPVVADTKQATPSHALWNALLSEYVSTNGMVDYRGFEEERDKLEAYLDMLGSHVPGDHWSREAKLAYYINLYNAGTVRLILEHYPLASIKDIRNPWGKDRLRIGDRFYSLNDIEHGILRKMEEPRIHFAVNCASFSCPKLPTEAFTAEQIDRQLDIAARAFINDPLRNRIGNDSASLSRLFKWYKGDFTGAGTSLVSYLNRYLDVPLREDAKLDFLEYDWSLNDRQ